MRSTGSQFLRVLPGWECRTDEPTSRRASCPMVDGGPAALVFFRSHTRTDLERSVLRSDALVGGRIGETVEVLVEDLREPRFVGGRS